MGLKTHSYPISGFDLILPIAYAKITNITIDAEGNANAVFSIQQSREKVSSSEPLEEKTLECVINKELPIYEQIYKVSKIMMFKDWEDDIVVDVVEELEPDYEEIESEVE